MPSFLARAIVVLVAITFTAEAQTRSGNPILPGWYADPEAHVFDGQYWIFPTYSAPYDQQTFMDAFSSRDLVTWEKHSRILDIASVPWARRAHFTSRTSSTRECFSHVIRSLDENASMNVC